MPLTAALLLLAAVTWADKTTQPKDSPANPQKKGSPTDQSSQGTAAPGQASAPTQDQMKQAMEQMEKLAQPGANHDKLKAMAGSWKATVKAFMGGPQPMISEGTSQNDMVLGGRYLEQRYKGTFMGKPFEGIGYTGYDNQTGMYQSVWMDNSSTWMMTSSGTMDDASKTLSLKGMATGMDGKPMEMRTQLKWADPSTMVFTMFGNMGGQEQPMMEITYKKAS
jgi:hypothetical protein